MFEDIGGLHVAYIPLNSWSNFAGVDLISGVSCIAPYKWVNKTGSEWEFNFDGRDTETFHVSIIMLSFPQTMRNLFAIWTLTHFCLYV